MLLIIVLIVLSIAFFFKMPKYFDVLIILLLSVITFLGVGCPDYDNYKDVYDYIGTGHMYYATGRGWYYICLLGNTLNMNFQIFKTIIVVISLFLVRSTVNYYIVSLSSHKHIWSLYMIFPALLDMIQFRYFFATAIAIYAMRFLFEKKREYVVLYILLVVLASTIHTSAIFYLMFVVVSFININQKYIAYAVIGFTVIGMILKNKVASIAGLFIDSARVERYLQGNEGSGLIGVMCYGVILFLLYILIHQAKKIFELKKDSLIEAMPDIMDKDIAKKTQRLPFILENVLRMNACCLILLPLLIFDTNFIRIQRIMWIFDYIVLFMLYERGIKEIEFVNGWKISTKLVLYILAVIGNILFISLFTFVIIQSLLL